MTRQELQDQLGQETKYSRWYLNIIFKAKSQNRTKLKREDVNYIYFEKHHILPVSLFPDYKNLSSYNWNAVLLTAKEHYICHALLWKHYKSLNIKPNMYKMLHAILALSRFKPNQKIDERNLKLNSTLYEQMKIEDSKFKSIKFKGKNNYFYGKTLSAEERKRISEANKGKVIVVDENGNNIKIPVDDPRAKIYPNINKGMPPNKTSYKKGRKFAKDKDGNTIYVSVDDPRFETGEIIGNNVGKVTVKDKEGNYYQVSVDDPRYLSGELVHNTKGQQSPCPFKKEQVFAKDKDGNIFKVSTSDPRYLSGELVHLNKGRKHSEENSRKRSIAGKGAGNNNAKFIIIYDKLNIPRFFTKGNFKVTCKSHDLPHNALRKSYSNKNKINYTKATNKVEKWLKYNGWYAREIKLKQLKWYILIVNK